MNCPACGSDDSKVVATVRWPTVDKRKHECKICGYRFGTTTMLVEDEALLECAALVTREWFESRQTYNPKRDKLSAYDSLTTLGVKSVLENISLQMESLREEVCGGSKRQEAK